MGKREWKSVVGTASGSGEEGWCFDYSLFPFPGLTRNAR